MHLIKIFTVMSLFFAVSCSTMNNSSFTEEKPIDDPGIKWENVDEVWAVVGTKPVLKSEVEKKYSALLRKKKIPANKTASEKSRILDSLINFIIIENKASSEGIIVSKEKVENQISDIMLRNNIKTKAEFEKFLDKNYQITLEEYKEEIRRSIMTNLVMVYAVDYKRPSQKDAEAFYRKKVKEDVRPFLQVKIQIIQVSPKDSSFQEEKAANTLINDVRKKALGGASFTSLAKQYSTDRATASKGGDLGWTLLGKLDPYIAGYVYQKMSKSGSISEVIKTSEGYYIVRYSGRRTAPFSEFEQIIYNMLSMQYGEKALELWLLEQREFSDVKIFMKDYSKK
ncbi:MAG: peptidylprolyl isomerase [Spirochaetes bacterium]|nr:peptidylprolyl isomerase [Spirochaetota bacterium]